MKDPLGGVGVTDAEKIAVELYSLTLGTLIFKNVVSAL